MKYKRSFPKLVEIKYRNQDIGKFFSSMPTLTLFVLIVVANLLIVGVGYYFGYKRYLQGSQDPSSPLETAVASILGLLAFMLGFTFSLTWARFSQRNSLVIAQAKTILVCYLRTSLLPEKQKKEIRRLFFEYVNVLIRLQETLELERAVVRINELHVLIWQQTASLVHESMNTDLRSLFVSSVDELISLVVERKTVGVIFRIPDAIWETLLFLAVMGMIAFGYQAGINGMNRLFQLALLPIAFGLVIVLIADLNSPGLQRRFRVTYRPLRDVMEIIEKDIP
jgi:hypothetical protein